MRFVSYLRVSTTRQGESGLGLEAQRAAVAGYLAANGGEALAEYVEVESGKLRDRPILDQALRHCRRERATLVIAKLDRLARNVAFASSLMEARTEFVAVDAPFANRLMIHILAAFAEHERDQIAARTKAALAAAKARGVQLGVNGAKLAEKRRQDAREYAESIRAPVQATWAHVDTLEALAASLTCQGVLSRGGAAWTPTTVRRVLLRLGIYPSPDSPPSPSKPATVPVGVPASPLHPRHALGSTCCTQ